MADPWAPADFPEAARAFVVLDWLLHTYFPQHGYRVHRAGHDPEPPTVHNLAEVIRSGALLWGDGLRQDMLTLELRDTLKAEYHQAVADGHLPPPWSPKAAE